MIHFETYQWEDHVPRKGGWKFNLAVGALAFGLIAAAMPEGDMPPLAAASSQPTIGTGLSAFDAQDRKAPAALLRTAETALPCPILRAGS